MFEEKETAVRFQDSKYLAENSIQLPHRTQHQRGEHGVQTPVGEGKGLRGPLHQSQGTLLLLGPGQQIGVHEGVGFQGHESHFRW